MIIPVIFCCFVVAAGIQITYYLFFSSFLFRKSNNRVTKDKIPISVIICAKNESTNLQKFLPSILEQNYPVFEVVLINDASTDNTLNVFKKFKKMHSKIKIIDVKNIEAFWGNKKYALTLGIKAAKYEHLLFTDADCKPVSEKWISEMSKQFTKTKSIILGYGKYKRTNTFINLLIRFETLLTAIQYFSYAKLGSPYMAVGRNLAYQKKDFFNAKGFVNHIHIKSGDDDLFIKDAATKNNTAICFSNDSFTESIAPNTLKNWFIQKRRHISTANHYRLKHKLLLGLFFISKFICLTFALFLFFLCTWKTITTILLIYYFVQYLVIGFSAKRLDEKQILYYLPILEILLLLFQFSIFINNLISKPTHWK